MKRYTQDDEGMIEGAIEEKQSFGSMSVIMGTPSKFTYKAESNQVSVFYLTRKDYEDMIGISKDVLDGTLVKRESIKSELKEAMMKSEKKRYEFELEDLDFYNILGQGAFGEVKLVQSKEDDKKVFALKTRSKHLIAEKGMRDHVLNEYRIMKEIEHPNIVRVHCAMQDEHHLYLLMDLLPGKCSVVIQ